MRGFLTLSGRMRRSRSRNRRVPLAMISLTVGIVAGGIALPAAAGADATVAPAPIYSSAPGLPDGRVYEQVSPADKDGNQAGAGTNVTLQYGGLNHYSLAAPDGNAVLFEGSGAFGETAAAYNLFYVAERTAAGWGTRSIFPRAQTPPRGGTITLQPSQVDPSADLSHVVFEAQGLFAAAPYPLVCTQTQFDLGGPDPFVAATWLGRPEISNPIENCGAQIKPVGGTPNFSTVYFTYSGTLLPEDAVRAPHAVGEISESGYLVVDAWGLYEYSNGSLKEAGVLPDGSLDPFGAVPAASLHGRALSGNQVSADGTRLFFVSPDPDSCGKENNCETDPPELYVRENGERTLLVSRDMLAPAVEGLPAGAPLGVSKMPNPAGSDVFASSDGSHAFFQSDSALTKLAEEASTGTEPKMYDFDVETGSLTYLPDVSGEIVAASQSGSSLAFINASASPAELDLWSEGPIGGTVRPITQLPGVSSVAPVRMSNDGSVVVFQTGAVIAGFNNGGGHQQEGGSIPGSEQIYRYDAPSNTLSCVSCPPAGTLPNSNAELSPLYATEVDGDSNFEEGVDREAGMVEEHGVSSDGSRIFFDTADPLVPQDGNTGSRTHKKGSNRLEVIQDGRDVYEWENGTVYLISTGKSSRNSYFLDSSENGSDVFFATEEGLVAGDTDGAYDVYDARIPHPGDNQSAAAVPCEGSVCQGPPRVPAPLSAPASSTFSGLGNIAPVASIPVAKAKAKSLTSAQKLAAALKACRKQPKKKRAKCESQVRKKYAPKVKQSTRRDK
jgi:hypothetical protein